VQRRQAIVTERRDRNPLVVQVDELAGTGDKLLFGIIVSPPTAMVEIAEVGAGTFDQRKKLLRDFFRRHDRVGRHRGLAGSQSNA
jgi:hypothetical protein